MDSLERSFFHKIQTAIFSNPFSTSRRRVDLDITGMPESSDDDEVLAQLMAEVLSKIHRYQQKDGQFGEELTNQDRILLRYGILFYLFHYYCKQFDKLISRQVQSGSTSLRVSFAEEVVLQLKGYGFSHQEALRSFALFFQLRRAFYFISKIKGNSAGVRRLRQALWNTIFTYDVGLYDQYLWNRMEDFSTILLGETGAGKGLAASAIGRSCFIPFDWKKKSFTESFADIFISINLSQYPEQLIESELFGHKKGAFTGAVEEHKGVFSTCSPHGAIFLDEIGEVTVPVQINLLQVLQERVFRPVGSHELKTFSGRVIAATNQNLTTLRQQGKFRDDFYYRLCSDIIEIPPLRERIQEHPDELKLILSVTIERILGYPSSSLTRKIHKLIQAAMPAQYPWPGNIRELEQCVRQMLLNRSYNWQQSPQVSERLSELQQQFYSGKYTAAGLLSLYCSTLYNQLGTLEKVAAQVGMDRRTVKKYIDAEK